MEKNLNTNEVSITRGSIGKVDFDKYIEHTDGSNEYFYNDKLTVQD